MDIEQNVKETIEKYNLIEGDEKVVVALSGGKDSTTVLYILKKLGYNVHGMMINLHLGSWSTRHADNMQKFCDALDVPFTIIDLKEELGQGICFIKNVLKRQKNLTGCTVCGIIKKWLLNRGAKKLGADKIATGHNLDDEAHTVLMNFLKGNVYLGINSTPATGAKNHEGFVQRIKPLFFTPEDEIRKFAKGNEFDILYDKCPCAIGTYRVETRNWSEEISNEDKLRIVQNFQESVIPKLRKNVTGEIKKCETCGEPCKGQICNACKIFKVMDSPKPAS